MNEAKLTLSQIEMMLEQLGLSGEDKENVRQTLLQKNNITLTTNEPKVTQSVQERQEPVLGSESIELFSAPVNTDQIKNTNSGKKSRFFSLAKSFVPFFSTKHENKISEDGTTYVQKTAVHAIADNGEFTVEKQKSLMDNIKSKAYGLGVTISQLSSSWNSANTTASQKFVNIMKFSGEATAVEQVETVLKESVRENNLKAEKSLNPDLIMEEVDESKELAKVAAEHAEKYAYEYDSDTGAIVFKNHTAVNANHKFMYIKRNFSHDIKEDLAKTMKYLAALENSKMTKSIVLLDNYAKSVDVFPGEIMKLLNENPSGSNLPAHPLLEKVLQNRVQILNDSVNISNEMIKTRVKESYLIGVAKKLLDYVEDLPVNDLSPANKEMRKSFRLEFLNKRIGNRKIGESINQHIGQEESLEKLNISSGAEVKKTSVEKANELASNINKSIGGFIKEIDEIHEKCEDYNKKIKVLTKLVNPTKKQIEEIASFKKEVKLYFTKYHATYQSFVEDHNKNNTEFSEVIGLIRKAKHTVSNEGISNKEYVKQRVEADRYNSNLLSGASNVVLYIVDTTGALGELQEQIHSKVMGECGLKFRDMDRLSEDYKEFESKFLTEDESVEKKIYGEAADLMIAYKELTSTFVKINEHVDSSEKNIISKLKRVEKIEDTDLADLKKSDVASISTSAKNTTTRFNEGRQSLEDEFELKFSAFRRLFLNTPEAKNYMKKFSQMGDFDISLWINSSDPLERLNSGFEISKKKIYARVDSKVSSIIEKRESIIVPKLNALIAIAETEKAKIKEDTMEAKVEKPKRRRVKKVDDVNSNTTNVTGADIIAEKPKTVKKTSKTNTEKETNVLQKPELDDIFDSPEHQPINTIAAKSKIPNIDDLAKRAELLAESMELPAPTKRTLK